MPKFEYNAVDKKGQAVTSTIEAPSQMEALNKISQLGYFATNVREVGAAPAAGKDAKGAKGKAAAPSLPHQQKGKKKGALNIKIPGLGGRVKAKQITTWTRQVATLIDAGLPLLRGLRVLEKQEKSPTLKAITAEIAAAVEGGTTFSEALAQHPKAFNKLYVSMVRAGEIGGVLEVVLNRLAEFAEKAQRIKAKVVGAMVYPMAVLFIAGSILTFLMIFIIPKFTAIFMDLSEGKAELPGLTKMVIGVSNFMQEDILLIIGGVAGGVFGYKLVNKTALGRRIFDTIKLRIPIFGTLLRKVAVSRFTRTLGTLISSGVPILQALSIVRDTAGNVVISDAIQQAHDAVKEGEHLVTPLEASGVFPPMVVSMIDVGEETGALPEMLMKIADNYDEEVDNAVGGLTSILEPIMIICLALIVGTIVVALFLPLISIITTLQG